MRLLGVVVLALLSCGPRPVVGPIPTPSRPAGSVQVFRANKAGGEVRIRLKAGTDHYLVVVADTSADTSAVTTSPPYAIVTVATGRTFVDVTTGESIVDCGVHPLPHAATKAQNAAKPSLDPEIEVHFWSRAKKEYVPVTASLLGSSGYYAFYSDKSEPPAFSAAELVLIGKQLDDAYPTAEGLFGGISDMDSNGRVIVVFSGRMKAERGNDEQATVDVCNLLGGPYCPKGEIIYAWSLAAFDDALKNRGYYTSDFYPRTILHETIHLAQLQRARTVGGVPRTVLPPVYGEGSAQLIRFTTPLGRAGLWRSIRASLTAERTSPASEPYQQGALFSWWLGRTCGPGIHQRLLDAHLGASSSLGRRLTEVLGSPEHVRFAEFYAWLALRSTALGATIWPAIDSGDLGPLPVETLSSWMGNLRPGEKHTVSLPHTRGAIYRIKADQGTDLSVGFGTGAGAVVVAACEADCGAS